MLSSATGLMEIRAQAERDSGAGPKLFGFIAESVFTFIPEQRSESSRNAVHVPPDSPIMQQMLWLISPQAFVSLATVD